MIDDGEFPYQKLFNRDGYTITKWTKVRDLTQLEEGDFDLILLDLHGVGVAESQDQGFGILKHIRSVRPAQIVVAYSNSDWSLEYQPFFELADGVLPKSADYVEFKRTVDDLLDRRFALGFYLDRVDQELSGIDVPPATRRAVRRAIRTGDSARLRRHLAGRVENHVTVDRVIAIVDVAIAVAALWTS